MASAVTSEMTSPQVVALSVAENNNKWTW